MVIWLTGMSGAGKSTVARALWSLLKPSMPELVLLDGDAVRAACGHDLGYAEADRVAQIRRLQGLARLLSGQGMRVIVAAVYARPDLLAWNRAHLPGYFEVYLRASLQALRRRDAKGLYAGGAGGRVAHVVGLDIPWHAPAEPHLILDTDGPADGEALALRVMAACPGLGTPREGATHVLPAAGH